MGLQEQGEFADFLKQLTLPKRISSFGVMGDSVTYFRVGATVTRR